MQHDDIENVPTNRSGNLPFEDILSSRISRRAVLGGGAAGIAAFYLGTGSTAFANGTEEGVSNLGFTAIPTGTADTVAVPAGYTATPFAPWGDPIDGRAPRFEKDASNPAEHQERQLGQGHDGMHYFPLGPDRDSNTRAMLCINHEYTLGRFTFPDGVANWDAPKTRKEQAGHGVSVIEIRQKRDRSWNIVPSGHARRITPNTKVMMTGPAAGHRLVKTNREPSGLWPRGIVNQCASAKTPWGTYLTSEENFNGYFWEETGGTAAGITEEQAANNARYGIAGRGFGYLWGSTDNLWRADLDPNRPNTFGYMVEIDPYSQEVPKKRSALGRSKHEGAAFLTAPSGQVVVYMGDDQRFDYIYKFVSAQPWADEIAAGRSPLDDGTLYVARFSNDDDTGEWLPLVQGVGPLTAENGFADQGDVVVKARMAADLVGATPMDRPEWTTANQETGDVYCTLTNNSRRTPEQVDRANPRGPNLLGHIIKWNEGGDPTATTFDWEIFLIAGGGASSGDGSTIDEEDQMGSPDGLWLDPHGILWIQTDGGQPDGSNNQMLACDPVSKDIKRFAVGPPGCEVTGVTQTPDGTTMFINIQHPGDRGTTEDPTAQSSWPDGDPTGRPRAATVVIQKDDGGRVGT